MGYVKCWTTALSILFIASCSSPPDPPPPKKNVFDPLTQQMDKARDVQKTVDEEAEKTRKAIDDQERGAAPR
jgi:PBP1b-binding outer membrane lipoprotein LpoB